jgi:trans-2,3-dihydro-3-hydroxyanthranilate isomerase
MKKHRYAYRIVNVFTQSTFGGNPLCVFESDQPKGGGPALSTEQMLDIARQFNLSETTFICASDAADARVRVFAPGYEMPFAGHPTLGTAHVVRDLKKLKGDIRLEFLAGVVPVSAQVSKQAARYTFTAPSEGDPKVTVPNESVQLIAQLVGLTVGDLASPPMWVNTGADQLLIHVSDIDAVRRAKPSQDMLSQWPLSSLGRKTGYVFCVNPGLADDTTLDVTARYFFTTAGDGVSEDPGTGSACANLGGWLLANGRELQLLMPVRVKVSQGEAVQRPCELYLEVSAHGKIQVGGDVVELGRGYIEV